MATHKLDKLFADKFKELEQNPSDRAWDTIEQKIVGSAKKNIWPWVGIAASALLAIISSWYMLSSDGTSGQHEYAYAKNTIGEVNVPTKIVFVPVIIQVEVPNTNIGTNKVQIPSSISENKDKIYSIDEQHQPIILTDNTILQHELKPIIQQPLPIDDQETAEIIVASAGEFNEMDSKVTQPPLTIIYKQGTPESKSKFTRAMSYLEDVRNGDKKLVNFNKIRESIQSKFKSNKETNSP